MINISSICRRNTSLRTYLRTYLRTAVLTASFAGLTACGGFTPDFEQTEAQQALSPAAEEAASTVRIAQSSEGSVLEVRDGDSQVRIDSSDTGSSLTATTDGRERVEVLIYEAASEGYCECDGGGSIEVNAEDGDSSSQVIVDGCDVFVSAQDGEDSATVSVRDDALDCGSIVELAYLAEDLALAANDVGDALTEVNEACDEMDAAGDAAGLTGDSCDPTGGAATDYLSDDIQEACDSYADAQDQCRDAEALTAEWYDALSDSSALLDDALAGLPSDVSILINAGDEADEDF